MIFHLFPKITTKGSACTLLNKSLLFAFYLQDGVADVLPAYLYEPAILDKKPV